MQGESYGPAQQDSAEAWSWAREPNGGRQDVFKPSRLRQGAGEMSEDTGMLSLAEAFRRVTVSLLFTFLSALPFSLLVCPHPSLKQAGWVSG